MLFISTNHKAVLEILPQDLVENFTLSILITRVVSEACSSFVSTVQNSKICVSLLLEISVWQNLVEPDRKGQQKEINEDS